MEPVTNEELFTRLITSPNSFLYLSMFSVKSEVSKAFEHSGKNLEPSFSVLFLMLANLV